MEGPLSIDVLGPAGDFRSRSPEPVTSLDGRRLASLSLAPAVYVDRAMPAMRRAPDLPRPEREAALLRAGDLFRSGTFDDVPVRDYQAQVVAASGLPRTLVETATERIAAVCERASEAAWDARPAGAAADAGAVGESGSGVWTRRGRTLAVLAAGNHPAVHANWIEALALGYRVAVRPSRREPFTAHRLVRALREAGFPAAHVAMLPSGHEQAAAIVAGADRSMVYGGDDVVRQFAGDPRVLPQGPGRAKIVIPASVDARQQVDWVAQSVTRNAGVSCTSTTAVFVEGDARSFAEELAARLASIPSRDPDSADAVLPVVGAERALQLAGYLGTVASGALPLLGAGDVVEERGDGTAVLRPAVHLLESARDRRVRVELPFPCVWVAPWSPTDGVQALVDTLVLTIADPAADDLASEALDEPSIRNVYLGAVPTSWSGIGLPHDDYLGSFLMESKSHVRRGGADRRNA